jgi:5'-3' exonuclease
MARGRLFLIDASGYVYRAFHALPALNTSRGLPTNATLGFANMVAKLLRGGGERDYLAVVFDAPGGRSATRSMPTTSRTGRPCPTTSGRSSRTSGSS